MPDSHFEQIQALCKELDQICETHALCSPIEGASTYERSHYYIAGDHLKRMSDLLALYCNFHAPCSEANRSCRLEFKTAVDQGEQAAGLTAGIKRKIDNLHSIQANVIIDMHLQKLDEIYDALCRITKQDRVRLEDMKRPASQVTTSGLRYAPKSYEIYLQIKDGLKYT